MDKHESVSLKFISKYFKMAIIGLCIAMLAACSSTSKVDPTAGWSAERLYSSARTDMSSGNWSDAREKLEALEARYPFGIHAQQALIDQAYVNWKDEEPEQAMAAIDRFMQQYPNHPGTDYMLYLKGLVTFTPPSALLAGFTRQDPSERDPKGLRASYDAFNQLINRYPDSRYTPDARKRVAWLVNTIAENEVHVATYYYERGAYVAAANRAQTVVTDFEGAPIVEKALYIVMISYDKLDLPDLSADAKRVLDTNFPDSIYYKEGLHGTVNYWNPVNWF